MKRNINKEKSIDSLNKIRRTNAPPQKKKYTNIPLPDELAKQIENVIKTADFVVDLGPEAGEKGGDVVVAGTPEEVARCPYSHTGKFLRPFLPSSS